MSIAGKSLEEFIAHANNGSVTGANKRRWHRLGQGLARTLALKMGLEDYDIRSCKGGPAVSGEIILHAEWIYIQFGISCFDGKTQFMYRTCKGMKDYTGGMNRYMDFDKLLDLDKVAAKLTECKGGE
jgi:hypothetical protein